MLRCRTEFECAPDGGSDEVAIYVAHMEACFRGNIPTLIAIHVLGEFHGIPFGIHEIMYSYRFEPSFDKKRF